MKFVSVLAAASLALAPMVAVAQDGDDQLVGVPPDPGVPDLAPIPEGTAAAGAGLLLLIGAGVGIGLAGGGGDGPPGTTGTTSTTTTTSTLN